MTTKYIWIKGQRFYLFDSYKKRSTAREIAKNYCKNRKCKYFIIETEDFWTGSKKYSVYFNRVLSLQSF